MKKKINITCGILLVCILSAISASGPAAAEEMTIPVAVVCTGVKERVPVGEATAFPADVGEVYCYTSVSGSSLASQIRHVWYYRDKEVFSCPLYVKAAKWRTWSLKKIHPAQKGSWRVEIIDDADGKVLKTAHFSIR